MIIRRIKITNFRCHEGFVLECEKPTSMISGENGCGKTSVLEAIFEATRGKSFRATDEEIVKRGETFYRVEAEYMDGEKVVVVFEVANNSLVDERGNGDGGKSKGKKSFLCGGKKSARLPKKYKYPIVLFEPGDLGLITTGPAKRRDYFDRSFSMLSESYAVGLSRYNKALRQRNELLKDERCSREAVFSWNVMLARLGVEIWRFRERARERINEEITEKYRGIAENSDTVKLELRGDLRGSEVNESWYLAELEKRFERDRILGHTGFGVHRDNYVFMFNGREADGSASRGEVRSIIVALKFIEAEMILVATGKRPVVLLDDVFSELDEMRQRALVKNFKENQVIITSVNSVEN